MILAKWTVFFAKTKQIKTNETSLNFLKSFYWTIEIFFSFFSQALFYCLLMGTRCTQALSSVYDSLEQEGVIEPKAGRFFRCRVEDGF